MGKKLSPAEKMKRSKLLKTKSAEMITKADTEKVAMLLGKHPDVARRVRKFTQKQILKGAKKM